MGFLKFLREIFIGPSTELKFKPFEMSEDLNVLDLVHIANAFLIFNPYFQYVPPTARKRREIDKDTFKLRYNDPELEALRSGCNLFVIFFVEFERKRKSQNEYWGKKLQEVATKEELGVFMKDVPSFKAMCVNFLEKKEYIKQNIEFMKKSKTKKCRKKYPAINAHYKFLVSNLPRLLIWLEKIEPRV